MERYQPEPGGLKAKSLRSKQSADPSSPTLPTRESFAQSASTSRRASVTAGSLESDAPRPSVMMESEVSADMIAPIAALIFASAMALSLSVEADSYFHAPVSTSPEPDDPAAPASDAAANADDRASEGSTESTGQTVP